MPIHLTMTCSHERYKTRALILENGPTYLFFYGWTKPGLGLGFIILINA